MHEMGIVSAMLKTIEKVMIQQKLTKVEKIVLQVGELSGVVPRYLMDCFLMAVRNTPFRDTKLELDIISGMVRCNGCGLEFNGLQHDLTCPTCGKGRDLQRLSGNELLIKEIQAY